MHVLSIGSLYKEYFLLKHEDSPVPHATYISQDFLRNVYISKIQTVCTSLFADIRPARHVLVQPMGYKWMMNLVMDSKIFSISLIVQSARSFHVTNCYALTVSSLHVSVRVAVATYHSLLFRLTHLWEVFRVIASLSLKIFTKAVWSETFFKIILIF